MSTVADPITAPRRSVLVPAVCAALCAVALLSFGPLFFSCFRPDPGVHPDFVQEWLSARNYWSGAPAYSPQRGALERYTGLDLPDFDTDLPWNAHPPVAVLAALPLGLIHDYSAAHLAWNLIAFPMFVVGLALVARELGLLGHWWSVAAGVTLVVSCNAVQSHIFQGQVNFVITLLLALAWVADRRGYGAAAGVAVGTAIALKLFPGLLLVYFAATGRWRSVVAAGIACALLNLAALALFGPEAFLTYVRSVLPSLEVFRGSWANVSLTGYWTRIGAALGAPAFGWGVALACQFAVFAAVWWAGRRATTRDAFDRAFALAVAGMLLASPVAWTHYFVLLPLPLLVAWHRPPGGVALVALALATAVLWLPERFAVGFVLGPAAAMLKGTDQNPGGIGMAVACLGVFPAALVTLFVVVGWVRPAVSPEPLPDSRPNP